MIVFPLKWLPYILAIGGFLSLITTGNGFSFLLMAVGVVWLYFIHKGKKEGGKPSGNQYGSTSANRDAVKPITDNVNTTNGSTAGVCPNCKTPAGDGMSFCIKCGTKVR